MQDYEVEIRIPFLLESLCLVTDKLPIKKHYKTITDVCFGFLCCLYDWNPAHFLNEYIYSWERWMKCLPTSWHLIGNGINKRNQLLRYESSWVCVFAFVCVCVCVKAEVKFCQFQSSSGWNQMKWRHIYTPNLEEKMFCCPKKYKCSAVVFLQWLRCGLLDGWHRLLLELPWYKFSTFLNCFPHQQSLSSSD